LTTTESFVGARNRAEALDDLSDAEESQPRAFIAVADAVTRHADTALTRPIARSASCSVRSPTWAAR
jgi:hypothetical protein